MATSPLRPPGGTSSVCLLGSLALLAACGGGGGGGGGGSVEPAFGLTDRVEVEGLAFPLGAAAGGNFLLEDLFPFLGGGGTAIAPDGNGRFFNGDKNGRIWSYDVSNRTGSVGATFLDLSGQVEISGEAGLLGIAFDPNGGPNGPIFVSYVAHSPLRSVVSRFERSAGNPLLADPASEVVLFERPRTNVIHCGGMIAFGPDGYLYASFGDDTQYEEAQNVEVHHGKILRMTKDGAPAPGNPFAGGQGDAPFVFAYGFRNVWRFSFDRVTGDLWAGDVGESSREEVDLVVWGGNYGWPHYEGTLPNVNPGLLPFESTVPPVYEYPHPEGKSVIGGFVYRGTKFPDLVGTYLFGDFVSGRILGLRYESGQVTSVEELITGANSLVSFAEDDFGELHASINGQLLSLVREDAGPAPEIPQLLSETGIFTDLATLEVAPGILPYDVVSPLWSDGSAKRRWIALPGLEQIQFDPVGNWVFPDGTVFIKHFEIEQSNGVVRRLETRVLWSEAGSWQGRTYRWNELGTDAVLLELGETLTLEVADADAPGGVLTFDWAFPSPAQCLQCHNSEAGFSLGVNTAQLNRDFVYPQAVDNQLRAWNNIQLFTEDIGPPDNPAFLTYADLADTTASLAQRARSYLAANCAHCHLQDGPVWLFLPFDLRAGIPQSQMNVVDSDPLFDPFGLTDAKRIKSFSKEDSVLYKRMETLGPFRMPILGSNRVDALGLEVIGQWADAGAPE